ncbi:GNAT family N-acetyltransferase [Kitasatospora sp. NA04385]|uniref:GNAT family N-acetyltransferase n=1 Tax=Kitasatospora sp. NA04385 TaxID=2742135 RepID=UPI0015911B4D|nr:GNAT family N-acetyltransferase [Kitasatospora sp. NA04385]QKW18544.1 GNAT family N-acetyltransferase [Kitasatospora sp. NA04385]
MTSAAPALPRPTVRPARPEDFDQWRALYRGYAEFYRVDQSEEAAALTWSWIQDPAHEVDALVAEDPHGRLTGLAHYRPFARPLAASTGCYLDDLFVAPDARGTGTADALLARLRELAAERGWSVVRWITADDNHRARARYDQVATRTMWVTYDMAPQEG